MEVQICTYEPSNAYNSDPNYGKINITSVIMCFLIIYSTALSIVLSVKQLIQIIKEEELLNEEEEEEEVIKEEEEKVIKEEELQLKYRKQIQLLFEEKIKNTARSPWPTNIFWDMFKRLNKDNIQDIQLCEHNLKPITDILMCLHTKEIETRNKELDEEIILNVKKAGLFVFNSEYDGVEFYKDTYRLAKIAIQIGKYYSNEHANQNNKQNQILKEYEGRLKVEGRMLFNYNNLYEEEEDEEYEEEDEEEEEEEEKKEEEED
jgi:hypothetical protein